MKNAAIILIILSAAAMVLPGAQFALAADYTSHEDPATITETLDAYSFLTNYADILGLVTSRAYENATRLIEQLKFVSIPGDLRYIINRYTNLTQDLINVLNELDGQLDEAERLLDQYRLEEAEQILTSAGILVTRTQILLEDLQDATSTLSSRLGVFAASTENRVKQAYSRLQEILQRLEELLNRFQELLTRLREGVQQIEQKQLTPTELTLTLNSTNVWVGQHVRASGKLTTEGKNFADRTIILLIDGKQVATVVTDSEGLFYVTLQVPYRYMHTMTMKALYTPTGADRGVYLAAVSPTITLNVNFYETKLEAAIPNQAHPGLPLKISGQVTSKDNTSLEERTIKVFLDGTLIAQTTTNRQGAFNIQSTLNTQTTTKPHTVTVNVDAKGLYAGTSTAKTLNITKIASHIEVQAPTFAMLPAEIYVTGILNSNNGPLANAAVNVELSDTTATTTTAEDGSFNVTLHIPLSAVFAGTQKINVTAYPAQSWQAPAQTQTNIFVLNLFNIILIVAGIGTLGTVLYVNSKNKPIKLNRKIQSKPAAPTKEKLVKATLPAHPKVKVTGIKGTIIEAYLKAATTIQSATGTLLTPHMTLREFWAETKPKLNEAAEPFKELTNLTEKTLYSPLTPTIEEGEKAAALAQQIEGRLKNANP